MPIDRFCLPVAVNLLLLQEDQILLMRRFQTGFMDGCYCPIAGCIEGGESVMEAMIREAREEAGIRIMLEDLTTGSIIHRKATETMWESISFFFITRKFEGIPSNCEPQKCDDMRFFPLNELPPSCPPYIRAGIKAAFHGPFFLTWGFDLTC